MSNGGRVESRVESRDAGEVVLATLTPRDWAYAVDQDLEILDWCAESVAADCGLESWEVVARYEDDDLETDRVVVTRVQS